MVNVTENITIRKMDNKTSMMRAMRATQIAELEKIIQIKIKRKDEISKKNLVLSAMSKFAISKRTAQEYVEVALFNEGIDLK